MFTSLNFSNQIETLVSHFAHKIRSASGDTVSPVVLVPNPYVKKWLQIQLAEINGISFNTKFLLLNHGLLYIGSLLERDRPERKTVVLDREFLTLLVTHILRRDATGSSELRPLAHYLFDGTSLREDYEIRLHHISERIARYLSEYEFYRMDMVDGWLGGITKTGSDMETAQRYIYLSLFGENGLAAMSGYTTLPLYMKSLLNKKRNHASDQSLPKLFILGESQMSPFHTAMIYELGKIFEIHLYQVNPCSEFWEDITTPREDRWERIRSVAIENRQTGEELQENVDDNQLLKAWGKAGRENLKLLSMLEESGSRELHLFSDWLEAEPEPDSTVLRLVQKQILSRLSDIDEPLQQDTSLQVFESPDIFREVETVYNSICMNLEADDKLLMTDVAVMVPDMNLYGPVIQAVFSQRPSRFTYSIIDFNASTESVFAEALLGLLTCARDSMTRTSVIKLLRNRCFLDAHDITEDDAGIWIEWITRLNIYRQEFTNLDSLGEWIYYTWQFALQRHRLGRIMEEQDETETYYLDNYKPYSDEFTADYDRINKFNSAVEHLYITLRQIHNAEKSLNGWVYSIRKLISDLISVPEDDPEELYVQNACYESLNRLNSLASLQVQSGKESTYSFEYIYTYLKHVMANVHGNRGEYLVSGVNISSLVPKRPIPFKIIYILGMSEGDFPGSADASTLDLKNLNRRIGDTSTIEVNQYLFLETLLSAREKLYLSYVSKDLERDRQFIPCSIIGQLVSHLNVHVLGNTFKVRSVPLCLDDYRLLQENEVFPWSDVLHCVSGGSVELVNYWNRSRYSLLKKVIHHFGRDFSSDEWKDYEKRISERKFPDIRSAGNINKKELIKADIRDLSRFIENPVEAKLRYHHNLRDDYYTSDYLYSEEPFYTQYPFSRSIIMDTLNSVFSSGSRSDIETIVKAVYINGKKSGFTPVDSYASVEMESLIDSLKERIQLSGNRVCFNDLIERRSTGRFFTDIVFGNNSSYRAGLKLQQVECPGPVDGSPAVALSGTCRYLWINDNGSAETVIITNSNKLRKSSLVYPFFFFIAALAGYNAELENLVKSGPFTIHVSHQSGVSSFEYALSRKDARDYLSHILNDFLELTQYDLLPFELIAGLKEMKSTFFQSESVSPEENEIFRDRIMVRINDDSGYRPAFRPMRILGIIDCAVPEDALEKVHRRYKLILEPVLNG